MRGGGGAVMERRLFDGGRGEGVAAGGKLLQTSIAMVLSNS